MNIVQNIKSLIVEYVHLPSNRYRDSVEYVLIFTEPYLSGVRSRLLMEKWISEGGKFKQFPSRRRVMGRGNYGETYQVNVCV